MEVKEIKSKVRKRRDRQVMLPSNIPIFVKKKYYMRKIRRVSLYEKKKEIVVFGLGLIPKEGIPEIKIRYNRSKKIFLGKITNSKDVANFIRRLYSRGNLELQEHFIVLYLNMANEILGYYKHSIGAINATIADVRLVFATALASASVSIIIAHNHPSRNLTPSQPDIELTRKISEAGKILSIQLLDHLIITKDGYKSFADEGMI
jgi:DNA repair protein RadC